MTRDATGDALTGSSPTIQVLDLISRGLRSGVQQVRSFALMPLEDSALRLDMIRNPRLSDRIEARLVGAEGWAVPDTLDDFPQAQSLIALLQHGPSKVFMAIGYAWHGNSMARLLLSGDKELGKRLTREELRQALLLRDKAQPDASDPLPSEAEITTDGELCVWCWMAALPGRVSALGLAVLLKHCCVHDLYKALPEPEKARRASLAAAWLRSTLVPAEVSS